MTMPSHTPQRRHADATQRNRDAILSILARALPAEGNILEIGSGTGQHAVYFAGRFPRQRWLPSDRDPAALDSIKAWIAHSGLANLAAPVALDVQDETWPVTGADALVCINVIHYSPWASTPALFRGAARILAPGSVLYCYGPYRMGGEHTAPSNAAFDAWLKNIDPDFGVRDLESVTATAATQGFELAEAVAMPANNLSLIFRRL